MISRRLARAAMCCALIATLTLPVWAQFGADSPLAGLAALQDGVGQRASSSDPDWKNGNGDAFPIEPGDTLVLADLQGPGVITHLWNTIAAQEPGYSRLLLLRMYWDGEDQPSVEVPIGDFFGVGHGMDIPFQSLPVAVSSDGRARNCYWPMPFGKSAKITVTNEGSKRINAFYYYVDWEKLDRLPRKSAYFHAFYRQEFPAKFGQRYHIASIEGRGHYVGTVLSVRARLNEWIGEGDDFFYIDGAKEPTLRGTGTEDYFCDAWGFREFAYPYYGVPLFQGSIAGDKTSVYRWHIPDPIRFKKSLEVEIEHTGPTVEANGNIAGYGTRPDDFSSVAYWYQEEPHKPFPPIPHGYDRFPPEKLTGDPFVDVTDTDYLTSWSWSYYLPAAVVHTPTATFTEGAAELVLNNPFATETHVAVSVPAYHGVTMTPATTEATLAPKAKQTVTIKMAATEPVPASAISVIPFSVTLTGNNNNQEPLEITPKGSIIVEAPFPVLPSQKPVDVDGSLADWPELAFDVATPGQLRVDAGSWSGPEDASFKFGVTADANYLYLAVDAVDDEVIRTDAKYPWNQDAIEVRLVATPDPERSQWRGRQEFGDALLIAASPSDGGHDQLLYEPGQFPEGTKVACVRSPKGFVTEIAVPVAYLNTMQKQPWQAVRLNIALDDHDADQRFCQFWWRPDWRQGNTYNGSGTFVKQ